MDISLKSAIKPADNIPSPSGVAKIQKVDKRKYTAEYIRQGFT